MTKELRRLSILVLLMFLALFASTSFIQALGADELADNPANTRVKLDSYDVQRGSIIASGTAIVSSVPANDKYQWQRVYTDAPMWAPVTGYFNPALDSRTGIEELMNKDLSGQGSSQLFDRLDALISGHPPKGANVMLTLDAEVQQAAWDALGDLKGSIVAIDPSTGRILAMVTKPSFDTNLLADHDVTAATQAYDGLLADPANPLYNRAIAGDMNPPGSTFKLVVAAAALDSGKYTETTAIPNPVSYQIPGSDHLVFNASQSTCGPGKTVTIADALRLSCNVPFAQIADELGDDIIRDMAERLGFGHSFEIPMATEPSVYPDNPISVAQTGFGQDDVRSTPLQMAMVSAAIANKGIVMNPTTVDSVVAADFSVLSKTEPSVFGNAMSPELAQTLSDMMVANVRDGVASGATIDGIDVAGKTGTAENGVDDPYSLWFTGFAPADNPTVAVAVVLEDGAGVGQSGSGDAYAAPIAKKVIEAVLNR